MPFAPFERSPDSDLYRKAQGLWEDLRKFWNEKLAVDQPEDYPWITEEQYARNLVADIEKAIREYESQIQGNIGLGFHNLPPLRWEKYIRLDRKSWISHNLGEYHGYLLDIPKFLLSRDAYLVRLAKLKEAYIGLPLTAKLVEDHLNNIYFKAFEYQLNQLAHDFVVNFRPGNSSPLRNVVHFKVDDTASFEARNGHFIASYFRAMQDCIGTIPPCN